jgi:arabinose-5-phosphate isomerase
MNKVLMQKIEIVPEVIRVLQLEGNAILKCAEKFHSGVASEALGKALSLLHQSLEEGGKIIVTGVGKSGKVGQKIAATLSSTGSLAVFLHPTEGLHGDLGIIRPKDVILALSYTGNTDELIRMIPSLKSLQVKIIGLGGNSHSQLAMHCDAWIDGQVEGEACPHNLAPTSSTTLALALGDAIAVTLMQLRGFNAASFALNHPGGSLGRKLNLRVRDLMQSGKVVPTVGPNASMREVVEASTEKKLGAVLVVEGQKMLGIITDGDLRRQLQYEEKFFQFKAKEIMTSKPVTVSPDDMAQSALELMENRPSQISVLPVINTDGSWKGLIRLHDLVRAF